MERPHPSAVPPAGTWLDEYRERVEHIRARAEAARARIATVTATARTRDGAVAVTVDGSGHMTGLTFGVRADDMPRPRLAETVLRLAGEAAADVAGQIEKIMEPLTSGRGR
ncbi:YbaB/EbfC family nucleoid-associated protein [Pseudonocardia sp. NPDC049635]|uniref:YbaB/EbfC family nucleoid-associated protein n=1 Tax=Pseudonocardia sp. NPDC049635 TaxID=3155506 RepID=UPI0033E27A45